MRTKSVFLNLICALSACTSLSSCASVINGKTQKVSVSSDPSGACVYVTETWRESPRQQLWLIASILTILP